MISDYRAARAITRPAEHGAIDDEAMGKIPITRRELADKVLVAIRRLPKCESVREISITPEEILDVGTTWLINIIDHGGADAQLTFTVARKVREDLEPLFEVID